MRRPILGRHGAIALAFVTLAGVATVGPAALRYLRGYNNAKRIRSRARITLQACSLPDVEREALCGSYEVSEDRAARAGRKISLSILVLPALSGNPASDAVFWLEGGPGAASTDRARTVRTGFLGTVRANRDLVFVDQRGTGHSNPLVCDFNDTPTDLSRYFGELFPRDKVMACRERLEKIADLKLYTTPIAMDDLDEVREALGYAKINVAGGSYGTIAAQVYMRQHPDHIRAVFLGGVATPAIKQPLLFPMAAQHALDLLMEDCAADTACHHAFPNLHQEFEAVLARFDKRPVTAELVRLSDHQKQEVALTRGSFVEHLRLLLYSTTSARFVPLIIHRAYENDYLPFEALATRFNLGGGLARGMYMTVTCSEGVPFISEQDIAKATIGTFVGEYRVRAHIEACKEWPKGNIPSNYTDLVQSDLPVLMISGDADGSTPPWYGEAAVKFMTHGRQVKIRYYGHQLDGPCVAAIFKEFIEKGTPQGIDTSCTESIHRPPFATQVPAQLALE